MERQSERDRERERERERREKRYFFTVLRETRAGGRRTDVRGE